MAAQFRLQPGKYAEGNSVNSCYQRHRDHQQSPGAQKSLPMRIFLTLNSRFRRLWHSDRQRKSTGYPDVRFGSLAAILAQFPPTAASERLADILSLDFEQ